MKNNMSELLQYAFFPWGKQSMVMSSDTAEVLIWPHLSSSTDIIFYIQYALKEENEIMHISTVY